MKEEKDIHFEGYVLYAKGSRQNHLPIGVITRDGKRFAKCKMDSIPTFLTKSLIQIEDIRFYNHIGIDFRSIIRAVIMNLKKGKILQGGSTITQQLARSIFQDNSRTFFRKIKEVIFALYLELRYSKKTILESYFNTVFWGKNLYGVRSASLTYFGKEIYKLKKSEQIILLTLLRGPNFYLRTPTAFKNRFNLLNDQLFKKGEFSLKHFKNNREKSLLIENNPLYAFNDKTIPFLKETISENEFSIYTTLDKRLQDFLSYSASKQKIPLSMVIIIDGKVKAVSSTHGNDYPFINKSNVGSTLKPFIYCILRENGIANDERFSTANQIFFKWKIKEATFIESQSLNIKDALLISNNNVFVNAALKVGLPLVFKELEKIVQLDVPLTPSIILGSSVKGISLYELSLLYNKYFKNTKDEIKNECLDVLNENLINRLRLDIKAGYFKTGTTNGYNERFAIFGRDNLTVGFLTEGYKPIETEGYIKDEDYIAVVKNYISEILNLL